jgi:hypothetical protein
MVHAIQNLSLIKIEHESVFAKAGWERYLQLGPKHVLMIWKYKKKPRYPKGFNDVQGTRNP